MKKINWLILTSIFCGIVFFTASGSMATEIITAEDIKQVTVKEEHLIKKADNFIIMFDSSGSMNKKYKETDVNRYDVLKEELLSRNSYMPDLGYMGGIYLYTPWKVVLPIQPYDRDKFAAAIDDLPEEPYGPSFLADGLGNLDAVLAGLTGRTAVFLFSDGSHYNSEGHMSPRERVRELSAKYDVCFTIISSAETNEEKRMLNDLAAANECSRIVPFEAYIDMPEFNSGALFVVDSTVDVMTLTDQKIADLKTDTIYFKYNADQVDPVFAQGLKDIADFLNSHPSTYMVIEGYADSVGDSEYNLTLSRRRAETVADHMTKALGIDPDRIVVLWHGELNPIATNDNAEGRSLNRRVEMAIGGLE